MTQALALLGFLGTGKTTLTLALADALLAANVRVAIIENERGGVGVDGAYLEAQGLKVRELRAGCVCCELTLPLRDTVAQLRTAFAPHVIILETSGVANADALRDVLRAPIVDVRWQFVTLLDTARFAQLWHARYGLSTLIRPQIAQADVLVMTKIDRVTEEQLLDTVAHVQDLRPEIPLLPFLPGDAESVSVMLDALALDTVRFPPAPAIVDE